MTDPILARLRELFPDAPRINRFEQKTGQAVWNINYRVANATVAYETIRGYSQKVYTFQPRNGQESRATSTEGWTETRLAALEDWVNSPQFASFKNQFRWTELSPTQEAVAAYKVKFTELRKKLAEGNRDVRLNQSCPDSTIAANFESPQAGRILYIEIDETADFGRGKPHAEVSIFGSRREEIPLDVFDAYLETLPAKVEEAAAKCTAGLAFLGKKPWENWTLKSVHARFEPIDEWLSTTVRVEIETGGATPTDETAYAWLKEHQKEILAQLPDKAPEYRADPDDHSGDSPRGGTSYPKPHYVVEKADAKSLELQDHHGYWGIILEDSDR